MLFFLRSFREPLFVFWVGWLHVVPHITLKLNLLIKIVSIRRCEIRWRLFVREPSSERVLSFCVNPMPGWCYICIGSLSYLHIFFSLRRIPIRLLFLKFSSRSEKVISIVGGRNVLFFIGQIWWRFVQRSIQNAWRLGANWTIQIWWRWRFIFWVLKDSLWSRCSSKSWSHKLSIWRALCLILLRICFVSGICERI